ncbi:MAG: GNAT family N-acetyltransferase [Candidatus Marinimicrobia bacterium]|nr:GNAT family N-acetyltransferase [Candidatus Neomarinimicrobiota bacterium]MCF7923108.1 GNAT family N-acetyltransferase [Candidatus Neomarinimicrobiota bacterium]
MKPFVLKTSEPLDFTEQEINSERLQLTTRLKAYKEEIFAEFNADIIEYMLPKPAVKIEETLAFINESLVGMQEGWNLALAITKRSDGEFLGCCGLHGKGRHRTPELGIWIKKSAHGHKFGREAIQTLAFWAVEHLDLDYLIYPVDRANLPSRLIAESLGGQIFAEKQVKTARGGYLDEVKYKITEEVLLNRNAG